MKRKREALAKKVADELQFPEGALIDTYRIEFNGSSEVVVEGCKGIVEYDESVVALNLGPCVARFHGTGLEISNFFEEQAVLKGTVLAMEFSS